MTKRQPNLSDLQAQYRDSYERRSIMRYVVASSQWYLSPDGLQYTEGYDERSVIAEGNTVNSAIRRAEDWWGVAGYHVFNSKTGAMVKVDQDPDTYQWVELNKDE